MTVLDDWAVARPVALIVAMFVADEFHVAVVLMSFDVPSPSVAVAANCCVWLGVMEGFTGVSLMAMVPLRIAPFSSSLLMASPPTNFSYTFSSASHAASMIFSRY